MRRFFTGILKTNTGSKSPWRTPDHPPYSQMVEVALRALSEEGGSTEAAISAYIESTFTDLPWGHDRLLPYYLRKLVVSGEVSSPSHDHYILSLHHHRLLSSAHPLVGCRGRRPIYRPNPRSRPSFKSPPIASPRRQGRSRVSRVRGRRPEIFAECTPILHLDPGSAPPRPRRGRPPLQRGGAMRSSVPRTRRPRGSRVRQDGGRGRKLSNHGDCNCFELIHAHLSTGKLQSLLPPGPNFSSEISALGNGKKDACSETCALQSMEDERGEGHRLVASPQPEHGEGQLFAVSLLSEHGEGRFSEVIEVPLLTLEPEKVSYCPSLEHTEHNEGNSSQREAPPSTVLEQTEPSEDQASPGDRPTILSLEKPENDAEILENGGHGPEKPKSDGHGPEEPGNVRQCLEKPENDGHGHEKPENDGHDPEKSENYVHGPEKSENYVHDLEKPDHGPEKPENDDRGPENSENDDRSPENPENGEHGSEKPEDDDHDPKKPEKYGHGPEKHENDGHGLEKYENKHENDGDGLEKFENDVHVPAMPENDDQCVEMPEEDHDKCSPGKRTAMVALGQEVLVPWMLPDPDEVGSSGASNKKRKSHGKRRRLKLWFEG